MKLEEKTYTMNSLTKKKNQPTRDIEEFFRRAKNPAYRLKQAILKRRQELLKQTKTDLGL